MVRLLLRAPRATGEPGTKVADWSEKYLKRRSTVSWSTMASSAEADSSVPAERPKSDDVPFGPRAFRS